MITLPRVESNPGHIYIMQSKDLLMKVGSSYVPEARRAEVSWMNGGGVLLLWMTPRLRYPYTIERLAQKLLSEQGFHHKGEWFTCTVFDAKRAIEVASAEVAAALEALTATATRLRAKKAKRRNAIRAVVEKRK